VGKTFPALTLLICEKSDGFLGKRPQLAVDGNGDGEKPRKSKFQHGIQMSKLPPPMPISWGVNLRTFLKKVEDLMEVIHSNPQVAVDGRGDDR